MTKKETLESRMVLIMLKSFKANTMVLRMLKSFKANVFSRGFSVYVNVRPLLSCSVMYKVIQKGFLPCSG